MPKWPRFLLAMAGLMGAAGVALAAYASHRDAGGVLMTAALFLILHAAPVAAIALAGRNTPVLTAATALALGAILFSGDLALRTLASLKPWASAAPTGGAIMILGWLGLALAAALAKPRP